MHVSPSEVAGLQQLGKMTGHKLHTNPHTGMPEAFDFGDFITNMLPTIAAIALSGPTGGTSLAAVPETMSANIASTAATTAAANAAASSVAMAPILGGMATGAAVAGAKGEDPLMGGIMGGVSGYGAQGLTKAFNNMASGVGAAGTNAGGVLPATTADLKGIATAVDAPMLSQQIGGANLASAPSGLSSLANSGMSNLSNVGKGLGQFATNPIDTYNKFTSPAVGGSGMQLATTFGVPAFLAAQDKPGDTSSALKEEEEKRKAEENKYRDPRTGLLNLTQSRPDLRLLASGGTINTNTSTISSGGIQDLYGTNDQTTGSQNLSKDGYGIGRLDNLASEGSRAKAADTFYAMGGPIAFSEGGHQGYLDGAGDGMSDSIPATIEGKQEARLADGEFVIPADVVSHIGNGSSKAGSKQLYAMLDRIRKARTGHTKQGKEIKPHKYMPA
jgi:hypothetical protein